MSFEPHVRWLNQARSGYSGATASNPEKALHYLRVGLAILESIAHRNDGIDHRATQSFVRSVLSSRDGPTLVNLLRDLPSAVSSLLSELRRRNPELDRVPGARALEAALRTFGSDALGISRVMVPSGSTSIPGHDNLYRGMQAEGNAPALGQSASKLGARIGKDIQPDAQNNVHPNTGGMSVSPAAAYMPGFGRPPATDDKITVWRMPRTGLGPNLQHRPDPKRPTEHGFVEPSKTMTAEQYQQAIAATRAQWIKVIDADRVLRKLHEQQQQPPKRR